MNTGFFELNAPEPSLRAPHCIAMLRPWVNVGNVGMITLNRLAKAYGAEEIGRLDRPGRFYDFTRYRPEIRTEDGERRVTVPNSLIFAARRDGAPDLVLLHMLEPQANSEDFNDSVIEVLKTLGVRRYILAGGMYDSVPHSRPLQVTGSARGWEPPPDFSGVKLSRSNYQGPTSMASQLSERVRTELGLETLSLIVHLPMYLKLDDDYAGAARILKVLSSLYGFSSDIPEMAMGAQQYAQVSPAMAHNPQLQEMVVAFEREYDQQQATDRGREPSLSPEIEEFLKNVESEPDGQSGQSG
ncbi:MAG: PAC2 family protein [Dehalococcoidia bacterium]|nr:PAC2 family protein [Dehalococcoidia bacterium]